MNETTFSSDMPPRACPAAWNDDAGKRRCSTRRKRRLLWSVVLILLAVVPAGCGPSVSDNAAPPSRSSETAADRAAPLEQPAVIPPAAPSDAAPPVGCPYDGDRDVWEVCFIQGNKVGHTRAQTRRVMVDGRELVELQWTARLKVVRFGQTAELGIDLTSRETADGRLVDFTETRRLGPSPTRVEGRVEKDLLILTKTSEGKTVTENRPWSDRTGGFQSAEYSLAARPMKPGETRVIRALLPGAEQVTMRLEARGLEPTALLHGVHQLLRIDSTTWSGDAPPIEGTLWADARGEVLKNRVAVQEVFRADRAEALDESELGKIDLGLDTVVPVDRPIPDPHHTRRIRYRISLADGDPARAVTMGVSQQVKPLGPHAAELTVLAVRPDRPKTLADLRTDRPTLDDVNPNSLVQSDDATIRQMAAEATRGTTDAWSKAVALERYVHEAVRDKTFSHAMASAAEVARTREGDCTEHAVLLAALARAADLPARVAVGLVYFDRGEDPRHVFGYHMWTEIYVDDRWIPMDATLGQGGIGAAHLKLAHGSLKDANLLGSFLPVVNVLGRLKIDVIEVE